ncbi:hypothetical protein [Sphingobacterium sp. 2149]|uniref:hypothetical protein n=1 Tax=Sphingobacterium sp. 2149 TaxID=2817763 RepID=UPI00285DD6A3|nr:hypothetical protein [Sphingobacterium sp. 2149]MDR6734167.1 hypothetical protein [Sphingobacterium sp. 2149]
MLDVTCTISDSAYVRNVTLTKDDRHVVNISHGSKDVPKTFFKYQNSITGILAIYKRELYNKEYGDDLLDIQFKAAKNNLPKPSDNVISSFIGLKTLLSDRNINFKSFTPIEEGGVLVDFNSGEKYFSMELYNDDITSIYIEDRDSGNPIMMDDIDMFLTNEIVTSYL